MNRASRASLPKYAGVGFSRNPDFYVLGIDARLDFNVTSAVCYCGTRPLMVRRGRCPPRLIGWSVMFTRHRTSE